MICVLVALLSLPMEGQTKYHWAERSNPWNQGRNINGLRTDSLTISYAELYSRFGRGGFRDVGDASSSWIAGALAQTHLHLEKMSMRGMFRFEQEQGEDMCGTMLLRPDNYPVNVVEFTPGRKIRQEYTYNGGLSYSFSDAWSIGGDMCFTSSNWAKLKDLRHTTYLLDLTVLPSLMYSTETFHLGLSYIFHKNSESVWAKQVGTSAEEYKVFFDKGLLYGAYENWEGNGVHLKESGVGGFPIRELAHGAALQFSWKDLYADLEYVYGSGKAGEKDVVWFEFPSHRIETKLFYLLRRPHAHHHFRLNMIYDRCQNNENIYEKETEGGVTIAHKYASNRILGQESFQLEPDYEVLGKTWNLHCNLNFNHSNVVSSQKYPYICTMSSLEMSARLKGEVSIWRFDLGAGIGFSRQNVDETIRTGADPGHVEAPVRVESYANQWLDYRRAPKLSGELSLRFNFGKGIYAALSGDYLRALDVELDSAEHLNHIKDPNRWTAMVQFGYEF